MRTKNISLVLATDLAETRLRNAELLFLQGEYERIETTMEKARQNVLSTLYASKTRNTAEMAEEARRLLEKFNTSAGIYQINGIKVQRIEYQV